ncbi:precorrin-6A reductase [Halocella sp. SP3-1]|uniref:precorrin-6A reductase n=1 Tax=Halocella sp. SP3-1 TaxID=2382161 RepID=UPI000F75DDF6|nr:precorrin-6A reductase [Halocella sp. SP3-1]AZO95923.1 precorrin-6A reductase [Halocella sp. SP3-1]
MIWVLAGTGDSFEIIDSLQKKGLSLIVSVLTEYAEKRLAFTGVRVIKKRLEPRDMRNVINSYGIDLIIDATHPFAVNVSRNVLLVSQEMSITYWRYEREELDLSIYPSEYILAVEDYQEAVIMAAQFKRIFLTIGSNNLHYFTEGIENWRDRLVARVLPDWRFIKKAEEIGFTPANLIAVQGPFTSKLNRALLEEYKADVLVSKASGKTGGLDTKITAALDLGIPVIIIKRPVLNYPYVFSDIEKLITHCIKCKGSSHA